MREWNVSTDRYHIWWQKFDMLLQTLCWVHLHCNYVLELELIQSNRMKSKLIECCGLAFNLSLSFKTQTFVRNCLLLIPILGKCWKKEPAVLAWNYDFHGDKKRLLSILHQINQKRSWSENILLKEFTLMSSH